MAGIGKSEVKDGFGVTCRGEFDMYDILKDYMPEDSDEEGVSDSDSSLEDSKDEEEDCDFKEFAKALRRDDKDVFVKMLNDLRLRPKQVARLDPLHTLFVYDAPRCLDAVLNGETAGLLEININAVPYDGYLLVPILHKAARCGARRITNYLSCVHPLIFEAQVNHRIDRVDDMTGVLPLNLAFRRLWAKRESRYFSYPCDTFKNLKEYSGWISEPSPKEPERLVLKWIFHLCDYYCTNNFDVTRLLAPKTHVIKQEFLNCLECLKEPRLYQLNELRLFELTALLMLARDRVMPGLEGSSEVRNLMLKEIADLKIFIFRSAYDIHSVEWKLEAARKKKILMEAILILFEIFDRIGDKIEAYLQHYRTSCCAEEEEVLQLDRVREVSWLLKEAGFNAELELLDEIDRGSDSNLFGAILADDQELIVNNESKQTSMPWLVNKQKMLSRLKYNHIPYHSLRSYHTYHLARGCRGFRSAMANKGDGGRDSSTRVLSDADHLVGSSGMVWKLQLRKQGVGKSAGVTRVCGWASDLQFNGGGGALSAVSSRRVLWITNKLGRAIGNIFG